MNNPLCDYPGCPNPATNIATAQGRNTPPKSWFACDTHKAEQQEIFNDMKESE